MANVPLPPIAPRTGLWGLGFRMELIALRFYNMYDDIKDLWLIGKWLSWPFYLIHTYFNAARNKCWQADVELVFALTWIKGITEGSVIIDLLEHLWYEFRYLRADPIGWVSAKIDQVSGELRYLRTDPYGWMRSRLYLAIPAFYSILGNSGWWIYSKLTERYPEFGLFMGNTWGYIRDKVLGLFWWARDLNTSPKYAVYGWINQLFPWFNDFMTNPAGTIINYLRGYNYNIGLLFDNPAQWFKERLAVALGLQPHEMDNFVPFLIKRMFSLVLSNYLGLLDYVENAICQLILKFI